MSTTEAPSLGLSRIDTSRVMHQVTAELSEIASAVDRVSESSHPTMELLEASRAIQSALVSLSHWNGSHNDEVPVANADAATLTLSEAWIAARLHDPWDIPRSTWVDA